METFTGPFGKVELTEEREKHILDFHPDVRPFRKYLRAALEKPDLIRRSKHDPAVFILYRKVSPLKYLAAVVKTNQRNFILTVYLTNKIQHLPI